MYFTLFTIKTIRCFSGAVDFSATIFVWQPEKIQEEGEYE
jgi:hypothetical protein